MFRDAATLVVIGGLALTRAARGDQSIGETAVVFEVTGPRADTCPDEGTFVAAVSRMMHEGATTHAGRIQIGIHADDDRVEGTVTVIEKNGAMTSERKLHGKECKDVSEGLALIVALTIDPLADPSVPVLVPPPPPPPTPTPVIPKRAGAHERVAPPAQNKAPPFHVAPLIGGRLTWGMAVDAPSLVMGVSAGFTRGAWAPSVRIDGGPFTNTAIQAGDGTVVFAGGEVEGSACPAAVALGSHFGVSGCLSGGVTVVSTRSIGYAVSHTSTTPVGFVGPLVMVRLQMAGRVGLVLEGGLRFPFESFVWDVQGHGAIGQTSAVVGTTAITLDFRVQ